MPTLLPDLARDGYVLLPGIFDAGAIACACASLAAALEADRPAVLRSRGQMYGSRDLISLWPEVCDLPRQPLLCDFLMAVLGSQTGLVRALFFNKPPERSWSLPWHRDKTIAVKDNTLVSSQFQRPTNKAGIPHVEAPQSLLEQMLTLRIHLDPMTPTNGPLSVIPGSHRLTDESQAAPVEIHSVAGDVFAMRPLISHSSSAPHAENTLHRRIVHLEFAASPALPDGYRWQWFEAV